MEITILDISFDFAEFENDSKLLWSVVPFANEINIVSLLSNITLYGLDKDKLSERAKIDFIKTVLGKWTKCIDVGDFERSFQEYLKVKRIKHKQKYDLIYLNRIKNLFEGLFNDALKVILQVEKDYKVDELHSFFSYPHKGVIGLFDVESHEPTEYCSYEVETATTTILNEHEIPLFTSDVEKYINGDTTESVSLAKELKQNILGGHSKDTIFIDKPEDRGNISVEKGDGDKKINIFREKFLEFVSPRSLTKNKLDIVRSELTNVYEPYGNILKSVKTDLLFNKEIIGIANAGLLYGDKLKPLAMKLQKAIDDNIYFQQIENSIDERTRYTLYFCVCSIEDLLLLFEKVSRMPKATIDFSREEIKAKTELERSTFFLYLKEYTDGNNDY